MTFFSKGTKLNFQQRKKITLDEHLKSKIIQMDYDARSSKVRNPRGTFSWKGQLEKKTRSWKKRKVRKS